MYLQYKELTALLKHDEAASSRSLLAGLLFTEEDCSLLDKEDLIFF